MAGVRDGPEGQQRAVRRLHLSRDPARLPQQLDAALPRARPPSWPGSGRSPSSRSTWPEMRLELRWSRVDEVRAGSGHAPGRARASRSISTGSRALLAADRAARARSASISRIRASGAASAACSTSSRRAPSSTAARTSPACWARWRAPGDGRTLALAGVAVVVTDQQTRTPAPLAVIDMSGPGRRAVARSARTHNVVISAWAAPGIGRSEYLAAIRLAGLKAAVYLARAARERRARSGRGLRAAGAARVPAELAHLPRVAYVFQIHSHQRPTGIDEGILYGDPVRRMLPTVIHPNEVLDGAVCAASWGATSPRRRPRTIRSIRALYAQHGRTLWFAGVVVTVAQATEPERVRSAVHRGRARRPRARRRRRRASPRSAAARRTWTWRRRPRSARRSA